MSEPNRPAVAATEMINAHITPPRLGQEVFALTRGSVVVRMTWARDSINFYDAWYPFLKVPADVKKLQTDRYLERKYDESNSNRGTKHHLGG
jgi:hypothetical protein